MKAADAGLHVLVQKPFAVSVAAGRMMVDAARRNGTTLGVTENVRYRRDAAGAVLEAVRPDVDDAFMSTFELRNGGIGQVSFTWAGHGPPTSLPEGMVIYGSQGCLKGERLFRDGQAPITVRDLFAREASPAERERWLPLGLTDSFAAGFYDFLTAIERGGQPEASGEEGLRDLATAFALLESAAAGQPVLVEEVLSGKARRAQEAIDEYYGLQAR